MSFRYTAIAWIVCLVTSVGSALLPEDHPLENENFSGFLSRLTRGGAFPGIRADASPKFQQSFYQIIKSGTWVGQRDQVMKSLNNKGIDIWGDWYQSNRVLDIVFPNQVSRDEFFPSFLQIENATCKNICRTPEELRNVDFNNWKVEEVYAFAKSYVREAKIFGGQTLSQHLANLYNSSALEVLNNSEFYLLNSNDFAKKLKELGWNGPIYFKGISYPDPQNPKKRHILIDFDLTKKMTPYDRPILQFLEFVGVLVHETSHAFQDFEAQKSGINLEIKSAEGVLLLEGSAEYLAEQAMKIAAQKLSYPSVLELYSAEQGLEVVYRDGNDTQGNLFPYTVGLPLAAALFEMGNSESIRQNIYKTIDMQQSLTNLLMSF